MPYYKHDISETSYIRKMDEKVSQYNGLIRKAERINHDLDGKPSKEEAVFYLQAAKVGEEIMNMNLSERAVYSQWKMRVMDCEAQAKRITDIIAPMPEPQPEPQPQEDPTRRGYAKKPDAAVKTTTKSGFKTNNACPDVKAETIEKWYKDAPNHDFSKVSGMEDLKKKRVEDPTVAPVTIATIPQLRMTRRIAGEYELKESERHTYFEDSIGMVSNWKKRGPVYEVPYRTLYSGEIKNLICAGRCTSVDETMWDIMRVIPCCAVTGQAAGTAAAMTDDFAALDVEKLQEELKKQGVKLHERDL